MLRRIRLGQPIGEGRGSIADFLATITLDKAFACRPRTVSVLAFDPVDPRPSPSDEAMKPEAEAQRIRLDQLMQQELDAALAEMEPYLENTRHRADIEISSMRHTGERNGEPSRSPMRSIAPTAPWVARPPRVSAAPGTGLASRRPGGPFGPSSKSETDGSAGNRLRADTRGEYRWRIKNPAWTIGRATGARAGSHRRAVRGRLGVRARTSICNSSGTGRRRSDPPSRRAR